jgi:hypothetical protein
MRKTDAKERKDTPIFSGVLKYFPNALAEVARVSKAGNDQHNPGQPLHWDRSKSGDEYDALTRHLIDRAAGDELDTDGQRHMAKVAWRALAALEKEIEEERNMTRGLALRPRTESTGKCIDYDGVAPAPATLTRTPEEIEAYINRLQDDGTENWNE